MKISELMSEEDILFDLPCSDKNEVIKALTENLAAHGHLVSAQECLEDVLKREAEISTGLVGGIAIPHTRSRAVKESRVSIGRLTNVIPWETIDGSAVQVVNPDYRTGVLSGGTSENSGGSGGAADGRGGVRGTAHHNGET